MAEVTSRSVTCLVAAPNVTAVETGDATWLCWGSPAAALAAAVRGAASVEAAVNRLFTAAADAAAVRLGDDGTVDAVRSVTATHDLYTVDTGTAFVVSDTFRNALVELPVEARRPAPSAVADHLLFRHPPEPDTYVAGVRALEHGTWLHREADGETRVAVVDRLDADGSAAGDASVDALDAALRTTLDDVADATNMLSGGVDSTLVHTYLGDAPATSMRIDSPEFDFEADYAARARERLGVDGETVDLREGSFLEYLEAAVDALGFPSHYNQTVLTDAAFGRTAGTTYVNAEGADALYGLDGAKGARVAALLAPAFALPGSARLWRATVGRVAGAEGLPDVADWLDRDPADPRSFAQRLPFFTAPEVVGRMTDPATVRRRHARSLAYVSARVRGLSDPGGFPGQVERAHLCAAFRHNTVDQWRQLAYVHGHDLRAPFAARPVVAAALSTPARRRYVDLRGLGRSPSTKHVPKRLLARRLPAYPVDQRKGSGSLPVARYFERGPLADVFERYDPPAFVPEALHPDHVASFGPVTWNLVTWAIWRDRVLRNPSLEPVPGTDVHSR